MLDYVALTVLICVAVVLFYAVIAIHDIPYEIAHKRDHPHADAIHAAGWVSLFTLHALWPFLWIWAMAYRPDRGWGFASQERQDMAEMHKVFDDVVKRLAALEANPDPPQRRRSDAGRPIDPVVPSSSAPLAAAAADTLPEANRATG